MKKEDFHNVPCLSGYSLEAAELDLVRSIPRGELPKWINYEWKYEHNKKRYLNRLKKENEHYYE